MTTEITPEIVQEYIDAIEGGNAVELPDVKGYSSRKVRQLLNALVTNVATHYLEIGVHTGSTFIPSIYGSETMVTCIDNWSRFGNKRPEFEKNLEQHSLLTDRVQIIEQDSWMVDLDTITAHGGLVDVYFYDGDHEPPNNPQYKAVDYYLPALADRFILLVDDANYPGVVDPTRKALKDNGVEIEQEWLLPGPYNGGPDGWWNGLLVLICRK